MESPFTYYEDEIKELKRVVEAAKTFMHYLNIRQDFSECHSVDHHGMTGRCNCHEKKEVEARDNLKKLIKELDK